jgi:Fe-S cluster biogenesis protein NfuA
MDGLERKVNEAIDKLRPYLHSDGGDMELVQITEDKVVHVRLLGACQECSMSPMTIRAGLEETLKITAPEVVKVVAVQEE